MEHVECWGAIIVIMSSNATPVNAKMYIWIVGWIRIKN